MNGELPRSLRRVKPVVLGENFPIGSQFPRFLFALFIDISSKIQSEGWGKGTVLSLAAFVQKRQPGIRGFSPQNIDETTYMFSPKVLDRANVIEIHADKTALGTLTRLPLDSPTLQKRVGYREILRAWLLTQAASALCWDRDEESYHGPTRNVATLYEYWIFLQLHQILDELPGVSRDEENPKPSADAERFLETKNGELVINLKRGKKTCAPFTITLETGMVLRLHLYYERTFQMDSGATEATSYSRQFKPDYTLAIFPKRFESELAAAADGKIAYVHFDAKYRAENMKMIFGDFLADDEVDSDKLENKATSTYQRGDLLKMHTYRTHTAEILRSGFNIIA